MHSMAPMLNSSGGTGGKLTRAPAAAYGRIWANSWLATFADGLTKEGAEGMILTRSVWAGAARLGVVLWSEY
jgi:alpha-glucosidase (family GH31 glycosyl hydrolase)|eukprot:SAG25_NODE_76_length_16934_cov_51.463202_3_plen_72_part_00